MRTSFRALFIAAATFALATSLQAATKTISDSDIKAEQRVATAMIADAVNDLSHSSNAYGNGTYKYAWVYLTDCGVKLDQTKSKLKDHPARIQVAVNFIGIGLSKDTRNGLTTKYYKIKDDLEHAYQKMSALEVDLGKKLGIDVASVRKIMSTLQILCDTTHDPKYCDAYARLKGMIDSGDIAGLAQAIEGMQGLLNEAGNAAREAGVSVELPANTHVTTSGAAAGQGGSSADSPAARQAASQAQSLISSLNPNDPNTSAYTSALQATQQAAANGDQAAARRLSAMDQARADCARNVPGACERLQQMLALLAKCVNGSDPSACSQLDSLVGQTLSNPGSYTGGNGVGGNGGNGSLGGGSSAMNGPQKVNVDGVEVTFVNGTVIKTTYLGGAGMRLKKEVVLKITNPDANPPSYSEVSSRDWNLVIQNSTVQSTATGAVVRFSLIDEGGRTDFKIKSWTVTSATGTVIQSGAEMPADVTFTQAGTVTVEVKGTTELGSDFTIRSNPEVSF